MTTATRARSAGTRGRRPAPQARDRRRAPRAAPLVVNLLDVGAGEYGDALLIQAGDHSVLVDGGHMADAEGSPGHPSIPDQLAELLDQAASAIEVDLLVVSHAHDDHIGCLPRLVSEGRLRARWALLPDPGLAWGRPANTDGPDAALDEASRTVVAALREELPTKELDDSALSAHLADAAGLEQRYIGMIDRLVTDGTKVVRFGRDDLRPLVKAFRSAGLRVLGPSQEQLLLAADMINASTTDLAAAVSAERTFDATADAVGLFRAVVGPARDAAGALDASRLGSAVNLQSATLLFETGDRRILMAGDMQLVDPATRDPRLRRELNSLREAIVEHAPYAFFKLPHHGSDNAFDATLLEDLAATPVFGVCAGSGSGKHPHPTVLAALSRRQADITWVRTDRNGRCAVVADAATPTVTVSRGTINDDRPNSVDEPPSVSAASASSAPPPITSGAGEVSVTVDIDGKRVHVSVSSTGSVALDAGPPTDAQLPAWGQLASGRQLPPLLFVTDRRALARNIGVLEATELLRRLAEDGAEVMDTVNGAGTPAAASDMVRRRLRVGRFSGVVLIGGYDVVPSQRLDCLPPKMRNALGAMDDPDDFIVWSDDVYGDIDGDSLPELPVSRVPDGKSADLVFRALQPGSTTAGRSGIRNVARPFAEGVFAALPGAAALQVSQPATYRDPETRLDGSHIYLMLHGDYVDASRFWGEGTPKNMEAVNVGSVQSVPGAVVLAGCCWGALVADTPASRVAPNRPFGHRTPNASLALAFLNAGALAFVGCTGAHYSPQAPPYDYFGGPMHHAFWRHVLAGKSPAEALFAAKSEYVSGILKRHARPTSQAIEFKIWRQFTCLGLGW